MSRLKDLIAKATSKEKTLIPMTIRLEEPMAAFVDEFAEMADSTRQFAFIALLEEGINVAKKALEADRSPDEGSAFHILNTNKAHSDEDQDAMLGAGEAAAFHDPWMFNIDRIKNGDWVFLYSNRVGIIAYGQGTGKTLVRDYDGLPGLCHYQVLKGFTKLAEPLTAAEIKNVIGRKQAFLRTMTGMGDGQKVLDTVKKMKKA